MSWHAWTTIGLLCACWAVLASVVGFLLSLSGTYSLNGKSLEAIAWVAGGPVMVFAAGTGLASFGVIALAPFVLLYKQLRRVLHRVRGESDGC